MDPKKKKMMEALVKYYTEVLDDDLRNYIMKNRDIYFTDEKLEEIEDKFFGYFSDEIYTAETDFEFIREHENDTVTLDKRKKIMFFNEWAVPAYWYKPGMSKKQVEENISHYKSIWYNLGAGEIHYPLLESWHSLKEWHWEFKDEALARMERDLECCDTEDALILTGMMDMRSSVFLVQQEYPTKIRRIIEIKNQREDDKEKYADVTLELYDGSICRVCCHRNINGSSHGMTALDNKGFPMMSSRDEKLIAREVFGLPKQDGSNT